eukprot:429499_1
MSSHKSKFEEKSEQKKEEKSNDRMHRIRCQEFESNKKTTLNIHPTEQIGSIKNHLAEIWKLNPSSCILTFGDALLDNKKSLKYYNIKDNAILILVPASRNDSKDKYCIDTKSNNLVVKFGSLQNEIIEEISNLQYELKSKDDRINHLEKQVDKFKMDKECIDKMGPVELLEKGIHRCDLHQLNELTTLIEDKKNELLDTIWCTICCNNKRDTIFDKCSCFLVCNACEPKLNNKCPNCQTPYKNAKKKKYRENKTNKN